MKKTIFYMDLLLALAISACSSGNQLTTRPIKWVDPDHRTIPQPKEIVENQIWDIIDHTLFFQIGKVLDLGWAARRTGNLMGVASLRQADNVNALDEVPNSSWFTNRHFLRPLSQQALADGPGEIQPDTSGYWEIYAGKFEGGTAGFTIKDAAGDLYLLKFDSRDNHEMGSAAEVIATKLLHAAGYYVPQNSVVYFRPEILRIGSKAQVPDGAGGKRPMVEQDVQGILQRITAEPDGRLRCMASKFLSGVPVGIFDYHGVRKDDGNDRVWHEHRRELRGLRVLASWMNDADRRAANTLDMYVTDAQGRRYVKHYIIDMGSTFGSNNMMPHLPKYGNEYVWDAGQVARSMLGLGFYRKPWEEPLPMPYPELGYFENQTFRPLKWVPTYPNPAFEKCTGRDGYWGAKLVMSFSDKDIATCVQAGKYTNPEATAELTRLLVERRDLIGRFWFEQVNPLDLFWMDRGGLHFEDLGVKGGLFDEQRTRYRYALLDETGRTVGPLQDLRGERRIPVPGDLSKEAYYGFEIRTQRREGAPWSRYTRVYFYVWESGKYQIVRVDRDD
ncbi:MAG: hypothetical protein O7G87_06215 [bacterium]|nr:hypothetical protein [bacterium]